MYFSNDNMLIEQYDPKDTKEGIYMFELSGL